MQDTSSLSESVSQAYVGLLQAELTARRQTVQSLPRMWQLLDVISLLPAAEKKMREPDFLYRGIFSCQGATATFRMPEPLTHIPLDPPCMPSLRPVKAPAGNAQAASQPKPSASDDAPAHLPNSTSVQLPPATTTQQPSTVASETQSAAPGDTQPPGSSTTQPGSALHPAGLLPQSQGGLLGPQPHQQASYLAQQKAQLQNDRVVQSTAQCMEADLILSEGAYECLTATGMAPGYKGNWEIPFTVQEKPIDPKPGNKLDTHRQQILLDMPLPRRLLNLREKHEMLYQHAVCHLGCSLSRQQQEGAEEAAGEGGAAATLSKPPPQQQGEQDQMLSDDDLMEPHSAPQAEPGTIPYSPTQDTPYSPSDSILHSPGHDMPYSPSYGADRVDSMTGPSQNSSLMPPLQPGAHTSFQPAPIIAQPRHDLSSNDMQAGSLSAWLGSQVAMERLPNPTRGVSQGGRAQQEDTQPASAAGHAVPTEALPAALPAVASDDQADDHCALDTDININADAFFGHVARDSAQNAGPWGADAAPQQGEGGAAHADATADASRHAGSSDPEDWEAGLCYRSYKLGGYSIVVRGPVPLKVPITRSLEVRICNLLVTGVQSWARGTHACSMGQMHVHMHDCTPGSTMCVQCAFSTKVRSVFYKLTDGKLQT